ncbi:MAG: dipeptide epimerase [Myxococcota bacterium]|nr:dipeptide epimerase [Myxococcota bacterium]
MELRREVTIERWPLARPFRTARITRTHTTVVVLRLRSGSHEGCSEHVPYERYGESPDGVARRLRAFSIHELAKLERLVRFPCDVSTLDAHVSNALAALPPGATRACVADAWLALQARRRGISVSRLLGLPTPRPVATLQSLGADAPERMADEARRHARRPTLKLKASGDAALDLARIEAVHAAAPNARLVIDANESWTPSSYERLVPKLAALGVGWIEQPFPAHDDAALAALPRPIPVCADESGHVAGDVTRLRGRYDAINVKLGKAGGLVGALATIEAARRAGMRVMVGCMVSTSLALAPAVIAAQRADLVDLDGASFLARDRVGAGPMRSVWLAPAPTRFWS